MHIVNWTSAKLVCVKFVIFLCCPRIKHKYLPAIASLTEEDELHYFL